MTRRKTIVTLRWLRRALASSVSGALCGLLAAAVALGVAELVAAITGPQGSPVVAVGDSAIDLTPIPVKDFAITHFGSNDKTALIAGILVLLAGFAVVTGIVARRWLAGGLAGLAIFGALGVSAAATRPNAQLTDVVPTLAGVAVGMITLVILVRTASSGKITLRRRDAVVPVRTGQSGRIGSTGPLGSTGSAGSSGSAWRSGTTGQPGKPGLPGSAGVPGSESEEWQPPREPAPGPAGPAQPGRRAILVAGAGAAVVAAATAGAGDLLLRRFSATASRAQVRLPAAAREARPLPAGAELKIPGLTSFYTPNASFYRVDTDLVLPQVSPQNWTLRIGGMVDHEIELSFDELLKQPLTEADITLVCVSDPVGGPYAGNARWLGASLPALLRRAGIQRGADQVLSTATDGMTISTPVSAIMDGRTALLAVGMNGSPLPIAHGFPARMLVPGLYGYTAATKWVTKLEVTTFAKQKAYWTQRGYAQVAPIKTESRIDVPKPLAQVKAGRVPVAGVAWAPHRGIDAVEVNVDGGPWQHARLTAADGIDTWRQWVWDWDASPGLHTLQVRATDSTGAIQPSTRTQVFPNGASGWDSTVVTVT
jgi:DMSO/TMAO reductase YedYZ molybdopterin-dependent catalytic subunit